MPPDQFQGRHLGSAERLFGDTQILIMAHAAVADAKRCGILGKNVDPALARIIDGEGYTHYCLMLPVAGGTGVLRVGAAQKIEGQKARVNIYQNIQSTILLEGYNSLAILIIRYPAVEVLGGVQPAGSVLAGRCFDPHGTELWGFSVGRSLEAMTTDVELYDVLGQMQLYSFKKSFPMSTPIPDDPEWPDLMPRIGVVRLFDEARVLHMIRMIQKDQWHIPSLQSPETAIDQIGSFIIAANGY
jgi:hypothetical protein